MGKLSRGLMAAFRLENAAKGIRPPNVDPARYEQILEGDRRILKPLTDLGDTLSKEADRLAKETLEGAKPHGQELAAEKSPHEREV